MVTEVEPVAGDAAADGALAAAGACAAVVPVVVKPQPCLPESKATATAEHTPLGFAQHPEAQSASLRHCPVMNCCPFPVPTFWLPGADVSMAAAEPALPWAGAAATFDAAAPAAVLVVAGRALPSPKPHPDFPFWNCAPRPEQMPPPLLLKAQHADAQSAELRHVPPMNCWPAPFPMFFSPAGSGTAGAAREDAATSRNCQFMFTCTRQKAPYKRALLCM